MSPPAGDSHPCLQGLAKPLRFGQTKGQGMSLLQAMLLSHAQTAVTMRSLSPWQRSLKIVIVQFTNAKATLFHQPEEWSFSLGDSYHKRLELFCTYLISYAQLCSRCMYVHGQSPSLESVEFPHFCSCQQKQELFRGYFGLWTIAAKVGAQAFPLCIPSFLKPEVWFELNVVAESYYAKHNIQMYLAEKKKKK